MKSPSWLLLGAAGLLAGCVPGLEQTTWTPGPLPALDVDAGLDGLPAAAERSPRNASYSIDVRLDPEAHTLEGRLVLDWRNISGVPASEFPFHLYWNAFRNNLSSSARGDRRRALPRVHEREQARRRLGYIHVRSVRLADGTDLTPTLRYIQPDDGNDDDRTLMEVRTPQPVPPGDDVRFEIEWRSRIPYGDAGRAGWVHDYNFIAQWFPKVAVRGPNGWIAHQFHTNTEFFSDYGNYDVRITLPQGFVVGATGREQEVQQHGDGSATHRYVQEDVHDFAWTASRRFLERKGRFEEPGYPSVELRLLLQPEHAHLAERYLEATRRALRSYGTWSTPYPYAQLTIVDPAWMSASAGMEYPTLFTGGASIFAPPSLHSPEGVTVHEAGHQFWYGLVGTNEAEEAWLDEGLNSYHTSKTIQLGWGPQGWAKRYFGLAVGERVRSGWPVIAPGVQIGQGQNRLKSLRKHGRSDVMARPGWTYRTGKVYTLNSYGKPALVLQTLEAYVGDETMTRILRTYARRYRFAHPTTADFIAVVNEVTGDDYGWFFDQTFFSSGLCDYAIDVRQAAIAGLSGYADGPEGMPFPMPDPERSSEHEAQVTVLRLGEVQLPVEIWVEFDDGTRRTEHWDGQERWKRFRYEGPRVVRRAVVDPLGKLALDVNPNNNSWIATPGTARRAATKWGGRFLFWLQNLLEMQAVFG